MKQYVFIRKRYFVKGTKLFILVISASLHSEAVASRLTPNINLQRNLNLLSPKILH